MEAAFSDILPRMDVLGNSQSAKSPLRKVFPPSSGIAGILDRTQRVWLSRVVLNEFSVSWWEQRALEDCLLFQEIWLSVFSWSIYNLCVSRLGTCMHRARLWQTTLGRRAKERQKGLILLPHRFLFHQQQSKHHKKRYGNGHACNWYIFPNTCYNKWSTAGEELCPWDSRPSELQPSFRGHRFPDWAWGGRATFLS